MGESQPEAWPVAAAIASLRFRLDLALGGRAAVWQPQPWCRPSPEPKQDVGLSSAPRRLLGQGGTSNNCLGYLKSRLVCV